MFTSFLTVSYSFLVSDLTYCGVIMDNENTLSSYGVCAGEIVYGTAKKPAPPVVPPKTYTETDIQNVVFIFSSFNISGRRTALQVLIKQIKCCFRLDHFISQLVCFNKISNVLCLHIL